MHVWSIYGLEKLASLVHVHTMQEQGACGVLAHGYLYATTPANFMTCTVLDSTRC